MANLTPFRPLATATLAVTSTSGTATVNTNANVLEFQNAGSATAFVRIGTASGVGTAVTTDYPILPGMSKLVSKASDETTVAAVCAAGQTTTLYISSGEGI